MYRHFIICVHPIVLLVAVKSILLDAGTNFLIVWQWRIKAHQSGLMILLLLLHNLLIIHFFDILRRLTQAYSSLAIESTDIFYQFRRPSILLGDLWASGHFLKLIREVIMLFVITNKCVYLVNRYVRSVFDTLFLCTTFAVDNVKLVIIPAVSDWQLSLVLILLLLLLAHRMNNSIWHSTKLILLVIATFWLFMERGACQLLLFEVSHGSGICLSSRISNVHTLFFRWHDNLEYRLILILLGFDGNWTQEALASVNIWAVGLLHQNVSLLENLIALGWCNTSFVHL